MYIRDLTSFYRTIICVNGAVTDRTLVRQSANIPQRSLEVAKDSVRACLCVS